MEALTQDVRVIIREAVNAGLELRVVGGALIFRCRSFLAPTLLTSIHKARSQIVGYMARQDDEPSADDWWKYLDSYEAMAEASGCSPQTSRGIAVEKCISEWRRQHPVCGTPKVCAHCALGPLPEQEIFLHEAIPNDFAWLHISCEQPWSAGRRSDAVEALARTEIIGTDEIPLYREVPPALIALQMNQPTTWGAIQSAFISYQSTSSRV